MIYVPNLENYKCVVVQDKDTIRAYKTKPYNPEYNNSISIHYTDYYINSNYLSKDGTQNFNYNSTLPTCLPNSQLTNEVYYRNDFDKIMVIFLIMVIFCFYIPLKVFMRLFRRFN